MGATYTYEWPVLVYVLNHKNENIMGSNQIAPS